MKSALKIALLVNDLDVLEASSTTIAIARELLGRGHSLFVGDVSRLGVDPAGRPTLRARVASLPKEAGAPGLFFADAERSVAADELDLIFARTNPARDPHRQPPP